MSIILDDGTPVLKFIIDGDDDYVDQGIDVSIGSNTIGSQVVGGGGEESAHPFDVTFPIHTDKCHYVTTRFEALGIGHAAVDSYVYRDIRDKGRRSLSTKSLS